MRQINVSQQEQDTYLLNSIVEKMNILISKHQNEMLLIAIDGDSGSGKSSLAKKLQQMYACNLFCMDDFFLPRSQKTKERLEENGGNVDYERFETQVILPLLRQESFVYDRFDCKQGKLIDKVHVVPGQINIIEGVYSLHKRYGDHYHLKILLEVESELQEERIGIRNGQNMLKRYKEEWIPLEKRYFQTLKQECAYDWAFRITK